MALVKRACCGGAKRAAARAATIAARRRTTNDETTLTRSLDSGVTPLIGSEGGMVTLRYLGTNAGTETVKAPSKTSYRYGGGRRREFSVAEEDVRFFLDQNVHGKPLFEKVVVRNSQVAARNLGPEGEETEPTAPVVNPPTEAFGPTGDTPQGEEPGPTDEELEIKKAQQEEGRGVEEVPATRAAADKMAEYGIDPATVTGTGANGNITVADVDAAIDALGEPDATDQAIAEAEAAGIDLRVLVSRTKGRIGKPDVVKFIEQRQAALDAADAELDSE